MDGYTIVTCIGKGSSGAVYLARSDKIKKLVAIKKIEIDESRRSRCRKSVVREANILRNLNHFHIVKCYEWFFEEQGTHISMVLEYCNGGTMQDRITDARKRNIQFEEDKILEWMTQITSAVDYIHKHRILHRDLKSENVFLLKSEVVKLGDFGISKEIDHTLDKASTCVGTPCYLSPELCQDIPYNFKSDIWALGCLLFEMCALKPAFDAANLISLFYKIVNGKYSSLPTTCSNTLKELIGKILVRNPNERPSANQLLNFPALKKYVTKVRIRSPDLNLSNNDTKPASSFLAPDDGELDDLEELLKQTETDIANTKLDLGELCGGSHSFSVCGQSAQDEYGVVNDDLDSSRPQTCPHSAVRRDVVTPTDTIATWSGYGDRGSRRPSGRRRYSSSSDDRSDCSSDRGTEFHTGRATLQRGYSSDEFSSLSDDDDQKNLCNKTLDEEIPEVIEVCEEAKDLSMEEDSPSLMSVGATRNLPGSGWLHSKRAQVLRQKEQQPIPISTSLRPNPQHQFSVNNSWKRAAPVIMNEKNIQRSISVAPSRRNMDGGVKNALVKSMPTGGSLDIVLGNPASKPTGRKHENLPGSGWLLGKSRKEVNHSPNDDYPDDFEDCDDDIEIDCLSAGNDGIKQASSLEVVKQGCIDTIGREVFDRICESLSKGVSIDDTYEKFKHKADLETIETCFLLIN